MEAVLRGKFIALSAHIKKMEKFFVCEVPGQQGALSLYQKIHWLGEYVPDRRQKPQKESTDIPQPFKLSLQGLLSQTTASLFLSHPSLHPSTPSLLLGHKTPHLYLFWVWDGVVSATGRESFISLSLQAASKLFCLRGPWPPRGHDFVPEDSSESI